MRQAIARLDARRGTHPGLILQRYLAGYDDPAKRRRELLDATRQAARSASLNTIYADAFARRARDVPQNSPHRSQQLSATGRLIVGLGSESVLEVGLRLHHTYGVPVIPGSALKGLASHYCHDVWGQRHDPAAPNENLLFRRGSAHHSLLFGSTDDGGVITFHDAWITPDSLNGSLRLDVMTPHHPKWQTNEAPPTDFDSPVPVSFLSVTGTFEVRLSWSGPAAPPLNQAEAWTALAMTLLQEALAEWGVGGKTSSGYGRLLPLGSPQSNRQTAKAAPARPALLPKPGEFVDAELLEEKTSKGGWKAMHAPSGLSGPIQNSGDVPADKATGETLRLIVAFANAREIAFRFPTPTDLARAQRAAGKRQGAPERGGRRK